ncbi:MAG: cysteine hydrolase [bacterium]
MSAWEMEGKPALILIHMQHAITDPEGKVSHFHSKATWESGIIPKQQVLLKAFREKGMPVIYVNSTVPPDGWETLPRYGRFHAALRKAHGMGRSIVAGTKDTEVLEAVANLPGEPVLGNFIYGIFSGNTGGDLKEILDDLDVGTLVMAGVATGMAVMASVIQAADMLYNVIVPNDASIDADGSLHEISMNRIIDDMALVTTTEDVIAHL